MKVMIDDVFRYIDADEETFTCDSAYKFKTALELILTGLLFSALQFQKQRQ